MEFVLNVGLLIIGFFMLVKGADWFVDGASAISARLGIPQLIIGLTIVAMGTSLPELAVSLTAALNGNAEITIGNVVGSNIMNVLVILGITAFIAKVPIQKSTLHYELPFMLGCTVLLLLFGMTGGYVVRWEGLVLVAAFAAYLIYLGMEAKKNPEEQGEETKKMSILMCFVFILLGGVCVTVGSDLAVDAASFLARAFGLSERIIGLTIVAFGTSLPELVTSVTAAKKGETDIAIGNIVGSNIFNILLIVGCTASITSVPFASNFLVDCFVAIAAGVLLWAGCLRNKELRRPVGTVMLVCYAVYFVYLLAM